METQIKIYTNPRNNKVVKPKYLFVENENFALARYEDFGTDWLINKTTGVHIVVTSKQFPSCFDIIKSSI